MRNLLKYTVGLPFLLFCTLFIFSVLVITYFIELVDIIGSFIMGWDYHKLDIGNWKEELKELWKPIT